MVAVPWEELTEPQQRCVLLIMLNGVMDREAAFAELDQIPDAYENCMNFGGYRGWVQWHKPSPDYDKKDVTLTSWAKRELARVGKMK